MKGFIKRNKNAIKGFVANAYKSSKKQVSKISVESSKKATIDIAESAVDGATSVIKGATEIVTQPISDIKYISARNHEIKIIIDEANTRIEPARIKTNKRLEAFGEVKIRIIGSTLVEFTSLMKSIRNLPFEHSDIDNDETSFSFTEQSLENLRVAAVSAKGLVKDGVVATAGGALTASAVYGTVSMLGAASTGTLISTLTGIVSSNATLAWLGGGAVAFGGGGVALGTLVLGGIALVPAISYFIWKGDFNFSDKKEKVDENFKEATNYSNNVDEAIAKFEALERFIDSATTVIERYNIACIQLNKQTINIISSAGKNYEKYTDEQKHLVEKHSNYIEGLLNLINIPIMNEDGALNEHAVSDAKSANDFLTKNGEIEFIDFKKPRSTWLWLLLLIIVLGIASGVSFAGPNESFPKAKKQLKTIYQDHQATFYCDCKYDYKDKNDMIDKVSCGYKPRLSHYKSGKLNTRSKRIEWEHVVPAENFGRQFACWRDGSPSCVKNSGKQYKGRKCCTKVSKEYRIMQADIHNLVPAIGELNGDRSNYRYDFELPKPKQYGACEFEVLFKERRARVKGDIRGNIARTYLYMNDRYGMKLSKQEQNKFNAWNKEDPVNAWESERNIRIQKIQGNLNNYIIDIK